MKLNASLFVTLIFTHVQTSDYLEFCPIFCDCTKWSTRSISCFEIEVMPTFHPATKELWLVGTRLYSVPQDAFANLVNLSKIYISDDESLRVLEMHSFHRLPTATHIEIRSKTLTHINEKAFKDLPNLKYLGIFNTGLHSFPVLKHIQSHREDFILEIVDNIFMKVIPANSFNGISVDILTLILNSNGLTEIQPYAFNGSRLEEVYLQENVDLEWVHERAFFGVISGPTLLDISETRVSSLPTTVLGTIEKLRAKNTRALKKLPPFRFFLHLQSAELTFPSHCCGLQNKKRWRGFAAPADEGRLLRSGSCLKEAKFHKFKAAGELPL